MCVNPPLVSGTCEGEDYLGASQVCASAIAAELHCSSVPGHSPVCRNLLYIHLVGDDELMQNI